MHNNQCNIDLVNHFEHARVVLFPTNNARNWPEFIPVVALGFSTPRMIWPTIFLLYIITVIIRMIRIRIIIIIIIIISYKDVADW